jgi:hypothetical protein
MPRPPGIDRYMRRDDFKALRMTVLLIGALLLGNNSFVQNATFSPVIHAGFPKKTRSSTIRAAVGAPDCYLHHMDGEHQSSVNEAEPSYLGAILASRPSTSIFADQMQASSSPNGSEAPREAPRVSVLCTLDYSIVPGSTYIVAPIIVADIIVRWRRTLCASSRPSVKI